MVTKGKQVLQKEEVSKNVAGEEGGYPTLRSGPGRVCPGFVSLGSTEAKGNKQGSGAGTGENFYLLPSGLRKFLLHPHSVFILRGTL